MKKLIKFTLIPLFWIGVWYLCALKYGNQILFPYPHQVFVKLFDLLKTQNFYLATLNSLYRIFLGTLIAIILGIVCAIFAAKFDFINFLLKPLLSTVKAVPVTVFVFIVYLILFKNTSMFICILMVFPIIFSNVYEGIINVNKEMLEVCKVYNLSSKNKLFALYIPSVMPYFISSLSTAVGLAWKAEIAAEVLCPPGKISIGSNIANYKDYIQNEELFATAIMLILLNLVIEIVVRQVIKAIMKKKFPNFEVIK